MTVLDVAAMISLVPPPGERYPYGPICLRDETKGYVLELGQYLDLVEAVEKALGDSRRVAEAIRRLYYSGVMRERYGGAAVDFDFLIRPSGPTRARLVAQDGLARSVITDLARCGGVQIPSGGVVDVSHVWAAIDLTLNQPSSLFGLYRPMPVIALMSWAGDLGSWFVQWDTRRNSATSKPPTESIPPPQSTIDWLDDTLPRKCPAADVYGDMDAIAFAAHVQAAVAGGGTTPLASLLRKYYSADATPTGDEFHVGNRFHLFCQACTPGIGYDASSRTLGTDADTALDGITTHAAALLLLKSRYKTWGMKALLKLLTTNATGTTGASIWSHFPGHGKFDAGASLAGDALALYKELTTPWARWASQTIGQRFAQFLRTGLAKGPWPADAWPDPSSLDDYNGMQLRLGDSDNNYVWGGIQYTAASWTPVHTLQKKLENLGFSGIGFTPGEFDTHMALALRDFQIEAGFTQVYGGVIANAGSVEGRTEARLRYQGPIHGGLDESTADVISSWLDPDGVVRDKDYPITRRIPYTTDLDGNVILPGRATQFRNPLVIDVRAHPTDPPSSPLADLWLWDSMKDPTKTVIAIDKSGRLVIPPVDALGKMEAAIGHWTIYTSNGKTWAGPGIFYRKGVPHGDVWSSAKVVAAYDRLVPAVDSPLRVVLAVTSVESGDSRDGLNAYDRAMISFGLINWALTFTTPNDTCGELAALLAYYRDRFPDAYTRDLSRLGWVPDPAKWGDPKWSKTQGALAQAKYAGRLQIWGTRAKDGTITLATPVIYGETPARPDDIYIINYFRSWRMIYRIACVLRTSDEFFLCQWQLARQRLCDLLARSCGAEPGVPTIVDPTTGQTRPRTFGEVFTSERAVALLYRYHVNRPNHVLNAKGVVGTALEAIVNSGGATWATTEPDATARQQALCEQLLAPASGDFLKTLKLVDSFKHKGTPLATKAGSFVIAS